MQKCQVRVFHNFWSICTLKVLKVLEKSIHIRGWNPPPLNCELSALTNSTHTLLTTCQNQPVLIWFFLIVLSVNWSAKPNNLSVLIIQTFFEHILLCVCCVCTIKWCTLNCILQKIKEKKFWKNNWQIFFFAASKGRRPFPRTSSSPLMFDRPTRYHNYDSKKSNTKSNRTWNRQQKDFNFLLTRRYPNSYSF